MMKSRSGIVAIVVIGVLCTGALAQPNDYVWGCTGFCPGGTSWTAELNWLLASGYPDDTGDDATIADVDFQSTCTFDDNTARTINDLEVSGDSPTWMKLHIKDAALTVRHLDLNDYGELDVDQDLTVGTNLFVSRNAKIDVASGKTMDVANLIVDGTNAVLALTTSGSFDVNALRLDGEADDAQRFLKLSGGTVTVDGTNATVWVIGDNGGNKAKLWLSTGSVVWDSASASKLLNLVGGDNFTNDRAELDLDQDMTLPVSGGLITAVGMVKIDIAANKTLSSPKLVIGSETILSVVQLVGATGAVIDIN